MIVVIDFLGNYEIDLMLTKPPPTLALPLFVTTPLPSSLLTPSHSSDRFSRQLEL